MFYPMPFNIFFLHPARCCDQSFKRIKKAFIKMGKQMKYFMNYTRNGDSL